MERIFTLQNLNCANCASVIEDKLNQLESVSAATFTIGTKQLRITSAEENNEVLQNQIQEVCDATEDGIVVVPFVRAAKKAKQDDHDHEHNASFPAIIVGLLVVILTEFTNLVPEQYMIPLLLATFAVLGWRIVWTAVKNGMKGKFFDENFLMSIATIGALIIGDYAEAVGVMLFFQVGIYFEERATERSRNAVMDAVDLRPEEVRLVLCDGSVEVVNPEDVQVGSRIEIRPGDRIPLDGRVIEGTTRIDTAAVTGEPVPVSATVGTEVMSGCINVDGRIVLEVTHELKDSMVMRILDAVENAAASKPKIDRFITRFSRVYTPIVVALAIIVALVPPLFTGEWQYWIYTALTFLVVSCPCALVLSVPLAFFSGIGAGSRQGILFKGGKAIEAMSRVKAIAFDKTGTITTGTFDVQTVEVAGGYTENEVLQYAAALEAVSTHPIAMSIVEEVERRGVEFTTSKDVKEISGHGMVGTVEGHTVLVGNGRLLAKENVATPLIDYVYGSEVFVAIDGQYAGRILIADALKDDSKEAIRRMNGKGYQTVMLTGDVAASANYIAQQVGIQGVRAELLPQDKLEVVQSLRNDHGSVMFVGDGINDAPVLTGADVGGAMGSGADSAIEAADVVYMNSNLDSVWRSLSIADRTLSIAWQNIFFAIAVKIIVMVAGVFGFANMWVAIFADTGVSILCILNSIRIFYSK
ncbi:MULTISPECIES: cation-translocating P-type ATPase [unclassified Veillonella]|uniref:heavy metal translocating P-type ATPase n=1 Tax=unclassified Veillonella TaxID=2630086 RepID=UPI000F8CD3DA|nr:MULTISPECIES: heavy metal translocating P-type ATPase [unclassified Veillonella]